ncbi:MAG TPA: LppX_LprAFG lipoprotein [Pedococcus sp.]
MRLTGARRGTPRAVALAAVVLAVALGASACTGDEDAAEAKGQTPAELLASARTKLETSPSVSFTLESAGLPGKAVGISGAKGTGRFTPPAFKGTLNATINGVTGAVDVIAVERDVFMKFFTPGYNPIDPADYGAPNPAQLFDTKTGITSLVDKTQGLEKDATVRDGADVLATMKGTLRGAAVADLLVVGDRAGTFDVTYGVTDRSHELRTVVLTGPFYEGATSTYTLRLKRLDQPVEITRP